MVKERLCVVKGKLEGRTDEGATYIRSIIDMIDKEFLFDGYEEFFSQLVPRQSQIVLSHVDTQENNILMFAVDNEQLMLIDYEFADWNPMAYDIANYCNECTCDNAATESNFNCGVQYYEINFPKRSEIEFLATEYLRHFYLRVQSPSATDEEI